MQHGVAVRTDRTKITVRVDLPLFPTTSPDRFKMVYFNEAKPVLAITFAEIKTAYNA